MRPVIGITAWRRYLPTFLGEQTDLFTLGVEYVDAIVRAGGAPIIIPHGPDAERILDRLDGLMLTGGDDVHPESYGDPPTDNSVGVNMEADRWEIALVRGAAERHMPTLAICRGMQIMTVAFGGRMVQHLEAVEGHPDYHNMSAEEIMALRHDVALEPACTLARVYGDTVKTVNSIHHQAVVEPGQFALVGEGEGGVIEAVEATNGWPAWGVQWHPEKMAGDPLEAKLFRFFVEQAEQFADHKAPAHVGASR
jgi:putative glutamine amidotransferase